MRRNANCNWSEALCGESYLDLIGRAYGVESPQSVYNYFHTFIDWIKVTFDFPFVSLLQGLNRGDPASIEKLHAICSEFAVDSDNCFVGCICAMDGLAIRISCPSNVIDPANYICRKNFYALNIQAICDRRKRILWIDPGHDMGACHDSTAWRETNLFDLLESMEEKLKKHGLRLSSISLSQVPYPNAGPQQLPKIRLISGSQTQGPEFNVPLPAAKLHNFLVDRREGITEEDDNYFKKLSQGDLASYFDGDLKPKGCESSKHKRQEEKGRELRGRLCTSLFEVGMIRPKRNTMRYNSLGHIYLGA
ncbi:hypothetical protein ACHAXR_006829 [Thalassiosira sp. AJA248-18]